MARFDSHSNSTSSEVAKANQSEPKLLPQSLAFYLHEYPAPHAAASATIPL